MLALHTCAAHKSMEAADLSAAALPASVVWVDLLDADAAEVEFVERATGLHVPTLKELSEIESSSRLRVEMGVLYLSTPIVFRDESGVHYADVSITTVNQDGTTVVSGTATARLDP